MRHRDSHPEQRARHVLPRQVQLMYSLVSYLQHMYILVRYNTCTSFQCRHHSCTPLQVPLLFSLAGNISVYALVRYHSCSPCRYHSWTSLEAVLWNLNDLLRVSVPTPKKFRFQFRFRILTIFSSFSKSCSKPCLFIDRSSISQKFFSSFYTFLTL